MIKPLPQISYPAGVPQTIGPLEETSLQAFYYNCAQQYSDHTALVHFGVKITYGELIQQAERFAAYLRNTCSVKKGERLAIMLPNCMQFVVAMIGGHLAGQTIVNLNPMYTARELKAILAQAEISTMVVLSNFAHVVEEVSKTVEIPNIVVTQIGDMLTRRQGWWYYVALKYIKRKIPPYHLPQAISWRSMMRQASKLPYQRVDSQLEDLAFLQFTGGTTGIPKGAMLTHKNILSNLAQIALWLDVDLERGREKVLMPLPAYHIFALLTNVLLSMKYGAENTMVSNPKDINGLLKLLCRHRYTILTGVNTLFSAMMDHKDFHRAHTADFKLVVGGGMAVQHAVARRWEELTGTSILEGYGLTECSPVVAANSPRSNHFTGTVGYPVPSTQIAVISQDGRSCGPKERGELWIRGPQVMLGYWRSPDETALVLTQDGWLKTGDVAEIQDDGLVRIVDRLKDMILISGFNVFPNEVEEVIASHEAVAEVGVVGRACAGKGEEVCAVVVLRDDSVTEDDLKLYCRQYLTPYKVPSRIEFSKELPKTNVGKVLRRDLKPKAFSRKQQPI